MKLVMYLRITHFTLMVMSLALSALVLAQDETSWRASESSWRAEHERQLLGPPPEGWLSLVAGYWLTPKATSIGSAPDNGIIIPGSPGHLATLNLQNGSIGLIAPGRRFPAGFNINGQPAKEGNLGLVGRAGQPSVMSYDSLTLYAVVDDDDYALYVYDTKSAARRNFAGLHWYPLDRRYVIAAKWHPFPQPVARNVTTHLGRTEHVEIPGLLEFSWNGATYRLEPTEIGDDVMVFSVHDKTNGLATYGGGRFLTVTYPSRGTSQPGEVWLDFNHLRNPPCVFSPYSNCPLAPEQNQLPFPLEVGEMNYRP
jgi:uncharacterized protein